MPPIGSPCITRSKLDVPAGSSLHHWLICRVAVLQIDHRRAQASGALYRALDDGDDV